ncbi:MAG: hypothetical protein J0L76_12200 [Rhodobacterales bacterium]|nr:hypothetical protein [Rhodobacterales bacterium]
MLKRFPALVAPEAQRLIPVPQRHPLWLRFNGTWPLAELLVLLAFGVMVALA